MRASTRLRVSAPTSAHPRTTLETVITETFRSRAMSFKRTGALGGLDMTLKKGSIAACNSVSFSIYINQYTYAEAGRFPAFEAALVPCSAITLGRRAARIRNHAGGTRSHRREGTAL